MPPEGELRQTLQCIVEDTLRRTHIPGISVEVSVAGLRMQASAGTTGIDSDFSMNGSTRFALGCITKMLTSIVALEAIRDRGISQHALLSDYFPELFDPAKKREIAIGHLASHTSGYQGISLANVEYGYYYSWNKFAGYFPHAQQVFKPGSVFNYEHTEGVILGELIHRITGARVLDLVRELVLGPLGLEVGSSAKDARDVPFRAVDHELNTSNRRYERMRSVPYCDFWSASLADMTLGVRDLVTIGELLTGFRRVSKVSPETMVALRDQLVSLPTMSGSGESEALPISFGFGCAKYGQSLFGHNGSGRGQTCALRFDPEREIVVGVGLNAWVPRERDLLVEAVVRATCPDSERLKRKNADRVVLNPRELEGTYVGCLEGLEIVITRGSENFYLDLKEGRTKKELRLVARLNELGELVLISNARHLSLGFVREPERGDPCVMVGLSAFRKRAGAT